MTYPQLMNVFTRLVFAKVTGRRVPFQVHIRVTEQCNRQCIYCKGFYPVRSVNPPTTGQLFDLIDGCARLGTQRITLLGGEALLRDDIDEVVSRVKHNGISCSLTTNGQFIDKHIGMLKNLDQISISIDGDRTTHDSYRGEGSWEAAINAIKVSRGNGIPVQLMATITDLSEDKLEYLTRLANDHDCYIDLNFLSPISNQDGSFTVRSEAAGEDKVRSLLSFFLTHRNPRVVYSPHVLRYLYNWPVSPDMVRLSSDQIPRHFKPIKCYGGRFSAFVDSNGDLLPCSLFMPDYPCVNAFKLGIETAWENMPKSTCITCRFTGYCMLSALYSLHPGTLLYFLKLMAKGQYT